MASLQFRNDADEIRREYKAEFCSIAVAALVSDANRKTAKTAVFLLL